MTESTRKPLSLKREALPHAGIEERLQKVLANAGLGSRRALDERIAAGYRFIGCSLDTHFIMQGCRALLKR